MTAGVTVPGRARLTARTLRQDRWWLMPAFVVLALLFFVVYTTWRTIEGANYWSAPYLSPLYSPCLVTSCVEDSSHLGQPIGSWWQISPGFIILAAAGSFRMTCYYYRKTYYRAFWLSPPACAVAEPHSKYTGETRFPLIFQNLHRFALIPAVLLNVVLTYDTITAFKDADGNWGHMGLGTLVLGANAAFLWLYTMSCHSCRHILGGRINHFSRHPIRYKAWTFVSKLNPHHPKFAWASLFSVMFADFYVRLLATGAFDDPRFF